MQHDDKHWGTIPFESVFGLRVARTLISDECDKAKIRVCNITERPLVLQKDLVISHLEKVDPIEVSTRTKSTLVSNQQIDAIVEVIDSSVPDPEKKQEFAIFFENTPISSRRTNLIWNLRT